MLSYLLIIACAVGGFLIANYIYRHKLQAERQLICPLNFQCDPVIHSQYSKFFGIPLEILGMLYYAAIIIGYSLFLFQPFLVTPLVIFIILGISIVAFLFSLYLIFIQAFSIKQWCSWCLASAGLCAIIFFTAMMMSRYGLLPLLVQYHSFILILHGIGAALGLGTATIVEILFFRFLKDFRISEEEAEVLRVLSQIIWLALAVLVLSGVGLYLPQAVALNQSAKFLVKLIAVAVIIINGSLLNLLIAPQLVKISFGGAHPHQPGELLNLRKLAFAMGAISLTSWYFAFILGSLRQATLNFGPLLLTYIGILAVAIVVSQLVELSENWGE